VGPALVMPKGQRTAGRGGGRGREPDDRGGGAAGTKLRV